MIGRANLGIAGRGVNAAAMRVVSRFEKGSPVANPGHSVPVGDANNSTMSSAMEPYPGIPTLRSASIIRSILSDVAEKEFCATLASV